MRQDLGCSTHDLIRNKDLRDRIDLERYITETVGLPTLNDILSELAKPGRDPREPFETFAFAEGIEKMEDLKPGMKLPGIVTNLTAFGAFVDIGVHQDGLVHVSELSNRFVKSPAEIVKVHQRVMVTVLNVEVERKRISLSMKGDSKQARQPNEEKVIVPRERKIEKRGEIRRGKTPKRFSNNPFEDALKSR
jgi:uncharacterized protein